MSLLKRLSSPLFILLLSSAVFTAFSVFLWIGFLTNQNHYKALYHRMTMLSEHHEKSFEHRQLNKMALSYYQNHRESLLEPLTKLNLLEGEKHYLEQIFQDSNYFGNDQLERRYELLKQINHLSFTPIDFHSTKQMTETTFELDGVTEVDIADLKQILQILESPHEKAPQYIITDLNLQKKPNAPRDTFYLHLKLLQREYL